MAASNSIVRAASTTWINQGVTGDWFVDSNWDIGRPNADLDAVINNGGTAQIDSSHPATTRSLHLGDNQGNSGGVVVDGTGAELDVFPSCETNVPGNIYVGQAGSGSLTITNGGTARNGYAYIASVVNSTKPASNGVVTVSGSETGWYLAGNGCTGAGIFIGCTATSNSGGTALLTVANGGFIVVNNTDVSTPSVKVGSSGTLTGNGPLSLPAPTPTPFASPVPPQKVDVYGTLAPTGTLTIDGNLELRFSASTVCHVTTQANDFVNVVQGNSLGGAAALDGRLSVTMTGSTFTPGMRFHLLHADAGRGTTQFASESITHGINNQCIRPEIQYDDDANNVDLYIGSCH